MFSISRGLLDSVRRSRSNCVNVQSLSTFKLREFKFPRQTETMHVEQIGGDDNYILDAKIDNVKKGLSNILKALSFTQEAVCVCSEDGLKFTVELSKCVQASAFILAEVFQYFEFHGDEPLIFKIHMHTLIEYLNMLEASGMSTTVVLRIQGPGHPLLMILEEEGLILDCNILVQEPGEMADFSFNPDSIPNKIILKSEFLKEIFDELDATSEFIGIEMTDKYFNFTASSRIGQSEFQIERTSDMIEYFDCKSRTAFRYRFEHLKHTIRALAVSHKVSVRMDDKGLLCFQCMVTLEEGPHCFVEYYCIQSTTGDNGYEEDAEDEFTLPNVF